MKRLFLFLFAAILGITQVWGATYTTTVVAYPTGAGTVSKTSTTSGFDASVTASTSSTYGTQAVYAKNTGGYVFVGWATSTNPSSYLSTSTTSTCKYDLKCYSYNGSTIYAIFKPEAKSVTIYQAGTNAGTTTWASGTIPSDVVDLGLPSGLFWCKNDLDGYYKWGTNAPATSYGSSGFTYSQTWTNLPTALGSGYRIPTKAEYEELINTNYTNTSVSNYQLTVTNKTNSNNKITFTKQGYCSTSSSHTQNTTYYWSSTYNSGTSASNATAYCLYIMTSASVSGTPYEYYACKIRPVYDAPYKTLTIKVGSYTYVYKCVPGQEVTVTPSATSGNNFTGWTGDYTGSDKPHKFTVSSNMTVTANFATAGYAVTIQNDGHGTATATANNGTLVSTSSVNLSATPSEGYEFLKWTLKTTGSEVDQTWEQNQTNVSITAACTIKAYFKLKQYTISASVDESCTDMGSVTGGGIYNHDADVSLEATAETGYHFERWSDGTNDITDNPYNFKASGNKTFTAFFASNATTYNITATKNIEAAGTATVFNGTGVAAGTTATLTATANSGYRFVKWTSNAVDYTANPLNVEVSTNAEYQAIFEALALREDAIYQDLARNGHDNDFTFGNTNYYTLTIIGNGKNTYKCLPGQQVKITVANEADWAFQKWSDENTDNPRTFTVSADATVRAIFVSSPGSPSSDPVIPTPSCDKIYQDNNSNGTTKSYATSVFVSGAVDLGLSVLWGTSDVSKGGNGFFSWGSTEESKEAYDAGHYTAGSTDIASAIMQGDWRMPTRNEWNELFTSLTWTKNNGTYTGTNTMASISMYAGGYMTSKTNVANGNSLAYWTKETESEDKAYTVFSSDCPPSLYFGSSHSKSYGMKVRGVYPAPTTRYTLTVKSQNGTTVGAKVNRFVVDNDHNTVTIYAQPKADGSRFARWSDGNMENPRTFTVTANAEITAEFIPYTGVISGTEWGTASNWGNNIMPNANCNVTLSSNVTIGSAIDNTNIFQVFAKANSLIIYEGNTLTVKSGAVLDVTSLTNNGTLAIEQGAILNVTGTLNNHGVMTTGDLNMAAISHLNIQPGAVVYVNGAVIGSTAANLTIMADATKMATLYLASASLVQPTATVQNYTVAKKVAETYTWQHYGIPTVSAPTMNAPATTYYYGWDNMNGWTKGDLSMVTTPFIGYNMTNEEAAASTVSFAGQLIGNAATTATLSRGWNFLANSYTTPVSTAAIINNLPAGAEQTICMYDPCYRGETNMSYVSAADVSDGTAGVATLLPMQTYFVEVKEGAGAINMDYADIAINPTAPASAPVRMNTPNYTGRVFINVESTMGSDVVKLRESADFSTAWDNGADASKMGKVVNSTPLLYVAAATRQAQLATDNLVGTVLGLEAGNTTDYTLTFSGLQGQTYILRDLATGVETEMTEDAQYHFSAEKGSANAARFAIVGVRKVTTDMGEASVERHSTKVIENGQVVIVRDGVRYSVLGTEAK